MEEQVLYAEQASEKHTPVRASLRAASHTLARGEVLLTMILCGLFCLLCGIAVYFFSSLFSVVLEEYTVLDGVWLNFLYLFVMALALWALVAPLLLGRLRMGGLAAAEREIERAELFYYFTSPRRYWRAIRLGALLALGVLLPAALIGGVLLAFFAWYAQLALVNDPLALWVLLGGIVAVLAVALLCLFLAGFYLPIAAVAVGNENISLCAACLRGLRMGRERLAVWFRFSLRVLLHFLLSIPTVGVLWLLYYAHHTTLAYWHLVREK